MKISNSVFLEAFFTCGLTTYCPRMAACKSKVRVSSKSLVNEATVEAGLGSGLWSLQKRGVEVWRLEERFLLNMGDVYSWRRMGGSIPSVIADVVEVPKLWTQNEKNKEKKMDKSENDK